MPSDAVSTITAPSTSTPTVNTRAPASDTNRRVTINEPDDISEEKSTVKEEMKLKVDDLVKLDTEENHYCDFMNKIMKLEEQNEMIPNLQNTIKNITDNFTTEEQAYKDSLNTLEDKYSAVLEKVCVLDEKEEVIMSLRQQMEEAKEKIEGDLKVKGELRAQVDTLEKQNDEVVERIRVSEEDEVEEMSFMQTVVRDVNFSFFQGKQHLISPWWILLDSESTISIFNNAEIVTNIRHCGNKKGLTVLTN